MNELELEQLKNANKLMGWLNDKFDKMEFLQLNRQNYISFQGVLHKKKSMKRYVIVANELLEINFNVKNYKYSFNGQASKGCKNIKTIDFGEEFATPSINTFKFKFIEMFEDFEK